MSAADPQDYRLPTDVAPSHYDLTVWTDLENKKFEGVVYIEYVKFPSPLVSVNVIVSTMLTRSRAASK